MGYRVWGFGNAYIYYRLGDLRIRVIHDPILRRGSRIQKGGGRTFRRGGGVVQEYQERIQIVAGSWANQQGKKIADSRRGGGSDHPPKNLYPRMILVTHWRMVSGPE